MESYWAPTSLSDRVPHVRQVRFGANRVHDLLKVLDSLQILRMVIAFEGVFGIKVEDGDMTVENLGSVRKVAALIARKCAPCRQPVADELSGLHVPGGDDDLWRAFADADATVAVKDTPQPGRDQSLRQLQNACLDGAQRRMWMLRGYCPG